MAIDSAYIWATEPESGYVPMSLSTARKRFAQGVSIHERKFFCQNCLQPLTLTKAGAYLSSFRHYLKGDKSCNERIANLNANNTNNGKCPIFLKVHAQEQGLKLYVGFAFPNYLGEDENIYCDSINIRGKNNPHIFSIPFKKLNTQGISYFSVGTEVEPNYILEYVNASQNLQHYWPRLIDGIGENGSFFILNQVESSPATGSFIGNFLPKGSIVYSEDIFFLLLADNLISNSKAPKSIELRHIHSYSRWNVFLVKVKHFDKEAADFFLRWNVLLTHRDQNVDVLWPPFVKVDNFLHFGERKDIYVQSHKRYQMDNLCLMGHSVQTRFESIENPIGKLLRIPLKEEKSMLKVGKNSGQGILYIYSNESLPYKAAWPQITLSAENGSEFTVNANAELEIFELDVEALSSYKVHINTPFDGRVEILYSSKKSAVYRLKGEEDNIIDIDLSVPDITLHIYQGLDFIKSIELVAKAMVVQEVQEGVATPVSIMDSDYQEPMWDDIKLFAALNSSRGRMVDIRHNVGVLADKLVDYPQSLSYLRRCIRQGEINQEALSLIKEHASVLPHYLERMQNYHVSNVDVLQYQVQDESYAVELIHEV